jgi:hypothetical protein
VELDKLTVSIRPRNAWEAIDLGFAMARHWFFPLWLLWLALVLPLSLLTLWLFSAQPALAAVALWWFKPLYEPPLLFWLSRALFGEPLALRQVLRQWPGYGGRQLLANLSWRRFSPNRSFYMPVAVLEGLKGKVRRHRISVLGRDQHAASWLTLAGLLFELILELSFLLLLWVMLPDELRPLDLQQLLLAPGGTVEWLLYVADLVTMSVIAPFYVAGGFALYLTRRSELEAWDIESGFRRLMNRRWPLHGMVAGLLLTLILLSPFEGERLQAAEIDRGQARAEIQVVLADDVFGERRQEGYWEYLGSSERSSQSGFWLRVIALLESLGRLVARLGEFLLWFGAVLLLAWLTYRIVGDLRGKRPRPKGEVAPKMLPVVVSGLDLTWSSLPRQLVRAVREQLDEGYYREALSLLYRGALSREVHRHRLEIPGSATEWECMALVQAVRPAEEAAFFRQLTRLWMQLAYDHAIPSRGQVEGLCREWESVFGGEE